jgi:hypothetical protein
MVDALNERINKLQREVIRQEDIDALPPGSYVPILSDIILPSVAMALVFILMSLMCFYVLFRQPSLSCLEYF